MEGIFQFGQKISNRLECATIVKTNKLGGVKWKTKIQKSM
jgi:hypothetical protein